MAHHEVKIPEDVDLNASGFWSKMWLISAVVGIVGMLGLFLFTGENVHHRSHSYLFAYMLFLSVALGSLAFVIIQHVVRAGWSVVVRRIAENAMMTLPLFALLFIPVVLGGHDLYHWQDAEHLDAVLQAKAPYLNVDFWMIRAGIYFAIWSLIALFFWTRSVAQDRNRGDAKLTHSMWKISGISILLFGFSQSFAAFDWLMSEQPHWYSTMFGVYYFAGSILSAFAFMTIIAMGLQKGGLIKNAITTEHYHDLGKFLFGFSVFWAYIGFSQFFLIWYANIPEETEFFTHRLHHGWEYLTYALPVTNFFVPFFFLLSRHVKRNRGFLFLAACYIFFMHAVDIWWLVMPNTGQHPGENILIDICAVLGVGGFFLAGFGFFLARAKKVIPIGDPRLEESLVHATF